MRDKQNEKKKRGPWILKYIFVILTLFSHLNSQHKWSQLLCCQFAIYFPLFFFSLATQNIKKKSVYMHVKLCTCIQFVWNVNKNETSESWGDKQTLQSWERVSRLRSYTGFFWDRQIDRKMEGLLQLAAHLVTNVDSYLQSYHESRAQSELRERERARALCLCCSSALRRSRFSLASSAVIVMRMNLLSLPVCVTVAPIKWVTTSSVKTKQTSKKQIKTPRRV